LGKSKSMLWRNHQKLSHKQLRHRSTALNRTAEMLHIKPAIKLTMYTKLQTTFNFRRLTSGFKGCTVAR
jgi:hypothetical protein